MLAQSNVHIVVMSVLTPQLLDELQNFPELIAEFGADEIYLQNYIMISEGEAKQYSEWMKKDFDINATEINSWIGELPEDFEVQKESALYKLSKNKFSIPVKYINHKADGCLCQSPYKHIHVSWNGNVMYCTDFYDFSAGNVKKEKLIEIFNNDVSEKFRLELEKNPTCRHCSWKNNDTFKI
jgi:radical SAM protein with 4Fe4S-binding SPASM domain